MLAKLAEIHPLLPTGAGLLVLLLGAVVLDLVVKRLLLAVVRAFVARTTVTWDDILVRHRVFERLVHIAPAIIVYIGVTFVPGLPDGATQLIRNVAMGYVVLMLTMALSSTLSAANEIYAATPMARDRPLKGFVQLIQIVVWILGGVMIVATILERSPLLLLSGFGAMTAILLLVFKDTILSLVASVQLTAQDMVRVGDWIEMPQFGADGDVIDVQLGQDHHDDTHAPADHRFVQKLARHVADRGAADQTRDLHRRVVHPLSNERRSGALSEIFAAEELYKREGAGVDRLQRGACGRSR